MRIKFSVYDAHSGSINKPDYDSSLRLGGLI